MNDEIMKNRVGKTPLIRAKKLEQELNIGNIYLKLEGNNPSKRKADRLAYMIIKDALDLNKKTICLGMARDLAKSLAFLCAYYNLKCVLVFPQKGRWLKYREFQQDYIELIEYGENEIQSIDYSNELSKEKGYYNANLGVENNILNMTALSSISEELALQTKEPIDSIFVQMSYGFSISGIYLGFRKLWMNDEISKMPSLYSCTVDQGNIIYDKYRETSGSLKEYTPVKKTKYNKYVRIAESKMMENTLDAIMDTNGTIIGIEEDELVFFVKYFKNLENIKLSIENAYALAGFIKKAKEGDLKYGNHIILLNDGHIDLEIKTIEEVDGITIIKLVELLNAWLMEYTDPLQGIREAVNNALNNGYILLAILDKRIVGISVIVNTGFKPFAPTYHLAYIATDKNVKGRGIATQLLQNAIDLTEGNISLHVERNNKNAIKLYEKMGFKKSYLRMLHQTW
ncbi:pyridoxal-phosphate dependent enzyme [Marinisporobacter balticus]|uniref:Threonine synthase n=1 Tax=Marinisporobacter balticus TaxID=2018667 RepID=A0A4R2KYX9_9FIRM|nr:pyridoxal-phosphate dependent enzyme [Marinisporobacter balticus]TCO79304.1 threonine synthase [Marinisporobacter balticus]